MKTLEEIKAYKSGGSCGFIDGRDVTRLAAFLPPQEWAAIGVKPAEGVNLSDYKPEPYTEEAVKQHLAHDLAFAFHKALNKRGISASLMYEVIKMWLWVLDDPLADFSDEKYAQYGLPLLKAVALQYNLPNPIGADVGDESRYSQEGD